MVWDAPNSPPSSHGRGSAAIRGTSARPSTRKHRSPGCPLCGHRGMTEELGVAKSVPAPASPFTPCRECAASAPTPSPPIPHRHPPACPGDLSQAVDGEAQVPRMPATRSPWDDGVEGCCEERAGARFALQPLPGVRRIRSNTITPNSPPSSHGRGTAAIRGTPARPSTGKHRSPGCPLRGHRGMTVGWGEVETKKPRRHRRGFSRQG